MEAATVSVPAILAVAASVIVDAPPLRVGPLTVDLADVLAADVRVRDGDALRLGGSLREAMIPDVLQSRLSCNLCTATTNSGRTSRNGSWQNEGSFRRNRNDRFCSRQLFQTIHVLWKI
jgi:hypothetical protein